MRKILIAIALLAIAPALFGSLYARTHSGALIHMYGISNAYAYTVDWTEYKRQCQEWWNGLWPLAKNGDLQARAQISERIMVLRFSIARSPTDFLLRKRDYLIWNIYGLESRTQVNTKTPERERSRELTLNALFGGKSSLLRAALKGYKV